MKLKINILLLLIAILTAQIASNNSSTLVQTYKQNTTKNL